MTRQDLITATLADPDAAWAVLTSGVKVAGPWETVSGNTGTFRQRRALNGMIAAAVHMIGGAALASAGGYANPFAGTLAEAESWCDQKLREAGWLLATGEVQNG